jgi:arsenite/tail-anchored protein-transporting ATPase
MDDEEFAPTLMNLVE